MKTGLFVLSAAALALIISVPTGANARATEPAV